MALDDSGRATIDGLEAIVSQPIHMSRLTPAGTGAIATVGILGANAWQIVSSLLRPTPALDKLTNHAFQLVAFGDETQTDKVVVTVGGEGASQRVELHCHGGVAVIRWIIDTLCKRGAIEVDWTEWIRRTSSSSLQSAATVALAQALTARTATILLDQVQGAFEKAVGEVLELLQAGRHEQAIGLLEVLGDRVPMGRHLTRPWKVVLAGAPNVGKSTLMNALVGYQRAITSPIPGTTRDALAALTAFDGWPVELVDTAGVQSTADELEVAGIERTAAALGEADLALWVLDAMQPPVLPMEPLPCPTVCIRNKIDLPAAWSLNDLSTAIEPMLAVSARTGEGIPELIASIPGLLVPEPVPPGAAVPFDEATQRAVLSALEHIRAGESARAADTLARLIASA
jgi:tRNA modification GTPase